MEYKQLFATLKIMGWVNHSATRTLLYSPPINGMQLKVIADTNDLFFLHAKDLDDSKHIWDGLFSRKSHTAEHVLEKINELSKR